MSFPDWLLAVLASTTAGVLLVELQKVEYDWDDHPFLYPDRE